MRKTRGFTIIEAMVVIAIIAIIAAIVIPGVMKIKASADAKNTPPRFEFSNDIGPAGFYAYLVKDTLTKKQFLVVQAAQTSGSVALDVTPMLAERKE